MTDRTARTRPPGPGHSDSRRLTPGAAPVYLGRTSPPQGATHSAYLARGGRLLVETYETDAGLPYLDDVGNPAQPVLLGTFAPPGYARFLTRAEEIDISLGLLTHLAAGLRPGGEAAGPRSGAAPHPPPASASSKAGAAPSPTAPS